MEEKIIRIVRMSFPQENIMSFVDIFNSSKPIILSFEGCNDVLLKQDYKCPTIIYTYSLWENHGFLDAYRNSSFFQETWSKTKLLFNDKPQAFSLTDVNLSLR